MPAKRKRKTSWEFVVRRKGVLPRPLYLTFADEAEGDAYCQRLEALLDRGFVPDEFKQNRGGLVMLSDAVKEYRERISIPQSDEKLLDLIVARRGADRVAALQDGDGRYLGRLWAGRQYPHESGVALCGARATASCDSRVTMA